MINLLLFSNFFPGANEEPFLRTEFPFWKKQFDEIYIHRNETVLLADNRFNFISNTKDLTPLRSLIKQNWKLLLSAWFTELIKSPKRIHYIKNYKKYFNIWMGWLQEAKAWEHTLKEFNPKDTIIYTYWYENQAMALTVLRAQGKLPFKWITRAHGWDVDKRQRADNLIPFRHWMLKHKPNEIVSISQFGNNIFKSDYGVEVKVARLGTQDLGLGPVPAENNSLSLVSIASIIPLKRVHLIIEILSKTKSNITWTHYGDGPIANSLAWESLPKNITLIRKGHTAHADLLEELKKTPIDFMIHLSELEGIPVSIMECMSLGIPVMACDTGGVAEIVDNDNGWLFSVNLDCDMVAEIIDTLLPNKQYLQDKRKIARESWEKEYQASVNFPKFIQTYLS